MNTKISLPHVLTPIATALAAILTGWVAKHFPGVSIPTGQVVPLMVLGGVAAFGACLHWLQKQSKVVDLEKSVDAVADLVVSKIKADPAAAQASSVLISELKAQKDEILKAVADAIHLPPSAEEVAQQIIDQAAAKSHPAVIQQAPFNQVTDVPAAVIDNPSPTVGTATIQVPVNQ